MKIHKWRPKNLLPIRTAIPPNQPLSLPLLLPLRLDLLRQPTLIPPIIPLADVLPGLNPTLLLALPYSILAALPADPFLEKQLKRALRPNPWTHPHRGKIFRDNEPVVTHERFAGGSDAALAVLGEGDVGDAGVAAAEGPFRLAVADDEEAGSPGWWHFQWGIRVWSRVFLQRLSVA